MQSNTQYIEEETINLKELFSVLARRKKLIWGITVFLTLFALVYVFVAKPVYEVRAMIEIGQIDSKPIDNINDIKEKLSYEYQVDIKGKTVDLPKVASISIPKNSNSILSMNIHGYSNEEAIQYIQNVLNNIETQYKDKIDAYTNSQKGLMKLIEEDIKENSMTLIQMQEELDNYSQKIISLKSEDAALAGIYALQIGQKQKELQDLKKYISELKNREQELKLSITPLLMRPTHIIGEIEILENPIKPKKALIIIVAFITSLMFSVFLTFFLEFINYSKKEEETQV